MLIRFQGNMLTSSKLVCAILLLTVASTQAFLFGKEQTKAGVIASIARHLSKDHKEHVVSHATTKKDETITTTKSPQSHQSPPHYIEFVLGPQTITTIYNHSNAASKT